MKYLLTILIAFICVAFMSATLSGQIVDNFDDGSFTDGPPNGRLWEGDTEKFEIISDSPVPGGNALPKDGSAYLASKDGESVGVLSTASNFTDEWQFSLASSDFVPLGSNFFGIILMSNTAITGDIANSNWNGYYIRIAGGGIELLRKDGTGFFGPRTFPDSPDFSEGALKDGLDIRITRNASGDFELFYKTGFAYENTPFSRGGVITDNTYSSSAYFGVFIKFNQPAAGKRVYLDNVVLGDDGDAPPIINSVSRTPEVPLQSEDLMISTNVTDDFGVARVLIRYTVNDGPEQAVDITASASGSNYNGNIPAASYNNGDRLTFWIYAEDNATATQAAESPRSNLFTGVTPISNLQAANSSGVLLYLDYDARITGVATVRNGIFDTKDLDVYVQDGSGGINIFLSNGASTAIIPNNSYSIIGKVAQVNGQSRLSPPDASHINNNGGGTPPVPIVKTATQFLANPESFEGLLVGIQFVENTGGLNSWPGVNKDAEIELSADGGASTLVMYVNRNTNIPGTMEPTWPRDVAGIFIHDNTTTGVYRINPRSTADILEDGALPVTLSAFSAKVINGNVILEWVTESEVDNVGFELMRSLAEDQGFQPIAFVDGQFTTNVRTEYEFVDQNVIETLTYYYKLVDVDVRGVRTEHGPISITVSEGNSSALDLGIPQEFALHSNYPNPFNPSTTLRYDVPQSRRDRASIKIEIFNALGQRIKTLVERSAAAGSYEAVWDGTSDAGLLVPAGVYFAVLTAPQTSKVTKMTLLK